MLLFLRDGAEKVRAIFSQLCRSARRKSWLGCGFLRVSVELVNLPGHPAVVAGRVHKRRLEQWLESELLAPAGIGAARLAQQIVLLLDGAFAVVLLHRDPAYFEIAGEAAATLIRNLANKD